MRNHSLIDKLRKENARSIKFLEEYYSERIGKHTTIEFDYHSNTSYFSPHRNRIVIATENLYDVLLEDPDLMRPMFYTILLHEIGHAIYTGEIRPRLLANVLEDNRLENQITKWNSRVNFKLLRYIFQDKKLADHDLKSKIALSLGLLRTVDNTPYVEKVANTDKRKALVKEILELNQEYTHLSDELRLYDNPYDNIYVKYEGIIDKVDDLIEELLEDFRQHPDPDQKQNTDNDEQDNGEQSAQGDPKSQEQDAQSDESDQGASPDADTGKGEANDNDSALNAESNLVDDLERDLADLIQKANASMKQADYNTPVLYNPQPDITPYTKHNISAFTTKRNAGIKGSRVVPRYSGNAKQLSLKKYMRKGFVPREKLFDRNIENLGNGGKNATAVFYLDISGSMSGYRLRVATDYLKSFYDTMSKHMDIKLYAFGANTYEITRNELNLYFLDMHLEGSTILEAFKTHNNEEIIVITDGEIKSDIPEQFKKKAHFVIIDMSDAMFQHNYSDIKHTYRVDTADLANGLDRATKGLKRLLG